MKIQFRAMLSAFVVGAISFSVFSVAHSDAFLKLGDVEGEETHHDEIEVLSWSWGASREAQGVGGSGGVVSVKYHDISVTKELDKATPLLIEACVTGKPISSVDLSLMREGDRVPYCVIELRNVLVSSIRCVSPDEDKGSSSRTPIIIFDSPNGAQNHNEGGSSPMSSSLVKNARSPEAVPTETLSLNFEEIKLTYSLLDRSGNFVVESVVFDSSSNQREDNGEPGNNTRP